MLDVILRSRALTKTGTAVAYTGGGTFSSKWSVGAQIDLDGSLHDGILHRRMKFVLQSSSRATDGAHTHLWPGTGASC